MGNSDWQLWCTLVNTGGNPVELLHCQTVQAGHVGGMMDHHPAPSWMLVVNALYRAPFMGDGYCGYGKYNKVLQLVKQKYLKGMEISAYTSIHVIRLCGMANCIV